MISNYLAIQNAILAQNVATSQMMANSNKMLSSIAFGNSQPLMPLFRGENSLELQNKTEETRISVLQKLIDSLNKALKRNVDKSTPKFAGLDYKA